MDVPLTVVDEDWQSVTYEAVTLVPGERVCCRFRDMLPRETALRRLARTYVVGMSHQVGDGECYHARQIITPCLRSHGRSPGSRRRFWRPRWWRPSAGPCAAPPPPPCVPISWSAPSTGDREPAVAPEKQGPGAA